MKKGIITAAAIIFLAMFASLSFAESLELTGIVKEISAEQVIVTDSEGTEKTFVITEDTGISEGVEAGSKVSIEAEEGKALFIGALLEN